MTENQTSMPSLKPLGVVATSALTACILLAILGRGLDKYESKKEQIKDLNHKIDLINNIDNEKIATLTRYLPRYIHLQDVNHDGLQDLVYKSKMIYFQTSEGTFATINEILESEKEKANARADSIRNVILKTTINEVKRKYGAK
jgi:hypothetical protein